MKAATLYTVWQRLNLWPWTLVLFACLTGLVVYGWARERGRDSPSATAMMAAAGSETWQSLERTAQAAPLPPEREASRSSSSPMLVISTGGAGTSTSGFKDLAGQSAASNYIATGSVFRAQLIMPIKTSLQERFVMAQTTHEFRDPGNPSRRIPAGSRLIGRARMNLALRSVDVNFTTLVSPRGREYAINALALSNNLFAQLNGIFFSNELETYSTIMAFGFVEGFADAARSRQSTIIGDVTKENLRNQVLDGVGQSSFRVAEELIRDIRDNAVEFVVVPSGEMIFAVFTEKFVVPAGRGIE